MFAAALEVGVANPNLKVEVQEPDHAEIADAIERVEEAQHDHGLDALEAIQIVGCVARRGLDGDDGKS